MKDDVFIILSPGFPKDEHDSTCLPAQQSFVLALKKTFPAITIIVVAMEYPFSETPYEWHGIHILPLNGYEQTGWRKLLLWKKTRDLLKKIHHQHKVIGLLSFWAGQCAFIGQGFAKKHAIPHYTWILGQDAKKNNRYMRWLRSSPQSLIAISDFIAVQVQQHYGKMPSHIIPYGIDPEEFPKEKSTRTIDILGTGSLIPLKQYDVFIDCIDALRKDFPGIYVEICGKGPEEKKLLAHRPSLISENNISIRGELSHAAVLAKMRSSKIFLHTSNYEGFSSACLEALYAGCEVVSFCKPMEKDFQHWHIVQTKEEMIAKLKELLQGTITNDTGNLPYSIHDTARKIMALYSKELMR
jgi:glycosyltransferase involved in cell wall biosynthesis